MAGKSSYMRLPEPGFPCGGLWYGRGALTCRSEAAHFTAEEPPLRLSGTPPAGSGRCEVGRGAWHAPSCCWYAVSALTNFLTQRYSTICTMDRKK